jgi:hypothetical protein
VREGGRHSIYLNPRTNVLMPVPRHATIARVLADKILRDARR